MRHCEGRRMCGIAGIFGRVDARTLEMTATDMAGTLHHRGPDDSGVWADADAGIALSHRRLSILDLSPQGHQPMASADGRYVLAFNGEIYNHQALRDELQACVFPGVPERTSGSRWRGHSDTEVMLAAFSAWGVRTAVRKFVGMFAIALWDRADRRLYLLRDRMGEKPLYYGWSNGALLFGSELKALKRYPGFAAEVDRRALTLYLRHKYIPAPYTIYRDVYKLQPGWMLNVSLDDTRSTPDRDAFGTPVRSGGLQLEQWWSLHEAVACGQASPLSDEAEALERLESRLREAVRLQSLADVPLGAFLSGGVDSSLIAALMQSQSSSQVRTFTIGFREKQYDEARYAAAIAKHLGTQHVELYATASDALAVIQRLPRLYDEPFADSSQIPTFLLCAEARKHLTVALSGDAGDELFGGYNRYFWVRRIWAKLSLAPRPARRLLGRAIASLPPHRWDVLNSSAGCLLPARWRVSLAGDKLQKLQEALTTVDNVDALYYSLVSEWKSPADVVIGGTEPPTLLTVRDEWPELHDIEQRMMYLDTMTYLPDDILVKVDRAAMGASLETRSPFLDHRVVETAWQLPLNMKLRGGQGKWALRQILYKYVPRELIERPKQGFSIPLAEWLRGPLREWAEELLSEQRLQREGIFHFAPVRERWLEHCSGVRNSEHALWTILMFQAWREATQ
jgi:asparagine synthase (glutamine-hydrolysing)